MTRHPAYDNEPIDWGDEPPEPPPPPSAGRSLRLGFESAYDYLAATIAASIVAFMLFSVPLALLHGGVGRLPDPATRGEGVGAIAVALVLTVLLLSPFLAGLYTLARQMRRHDDPHLLDVARGARRLALPSIALGAVHALVLLVLVSDVLFLLSRPETPLKLTAVALAYVGLFWAMMAGYHWPLLVEQNPGLRRILYRGFLLAAANPFYTLTVTLAVLLLVSLPTAFLLGSRYGPAVLVPISMVWAVLIASMQTCATLEILRKYDAE